MVLLAGIGIGCSKKPTPAPALQAKPSGPTPTDVRQQLETRDVTVAQRDDERKPQWTIKGEKALINVSENGKISGSMDGVTGELFDDGKPASKFSAKHGEADQNRNTLKVNGAVTVTDPKTGMRLTADRMQWLATRNLIEASGNVRVIGADYEVGPMQMVLATPDLKKFGTPDRFPPAKK